MRTRWQDILGRPDWWWGTVTSVAPLLVAKDNSTVPVPVTGGPAVTEGDRVMVQMNGTAPTITVVQPRALPATAQFRGASVTTVSATSWADVAGTEGTFDTPGPVLALVTFSGWLATIAGGDRDLRVRCAWSGVGGAGSTGDSYSLMQWPGVLYLGAASTGDQNQYHSDSLTFTVPLAAGSTQFRLQAYTVGPGSGNPSLNYPQTRVQPLGWA